ncbi:MAG: glycosyltransferase family 2 protein [Chthoniobacterales bacterium]|nr:glycosyltransferase family 2 protein [Chthoniobacterales bacterium]
MKFFKKKIPPPEKPPTYEEWLRRFAGIDPIALRRNLRQLKEQPLVSILLPVYNPDLDLLEAAIASVRRQIYERWELCIADDASDDPQVRSRLKQAAADEPRIRLIFREQNGHIAACTNSALQLATGSWCALLDQDDLLAEDALAQFALELDRHPDAGLIYSDEDKIDEADARSSPYFKPDWNPELFLGQNFVNHLGLYRTDLVRQVGAFREGFEGSQDYDLVLRCVEQLEARQIRHIPRVLYHWRMVTGSVAAAPDAKPYAREAARRAITEHLERQNIAGKVEANPDNPEAHRVVYSLGARVPAVSIIIPIRDRVELLQRCLESIRAKTDYAEYEFLIVDNGSREKETLDFLQALERGGEARVLRADGPYNFSRLTNAGAAAAGGEILLFLNNDIEAIEPGWLREMVSHAARPAVGAVGARLWFPDGTLQHGGVIVGLGGVAGHAFPHLKRGRGGYFSRAQLQQNISAVTGACLAVRKEVFDNVGPFDEENLSISFNDIDFCLRLRAAGYRNVWTPFANLIHAESASRGHQPTKKEQIHFVTEATFMQQKWGFELLHDPCYNPNLSLNLPGFELAVPPRL